MCALSVRLPESLHRAAREVATQDGVSINQLIASASGEKIAALKTVEFLRERGPGRLCRRFCGCLGVGAGCGTGRT